MTEEISKNWTVISLGGSLIVPDKVDAGYIKKFVELIKSEVSRGGKFAIITGGGKVAREYRDALINVGVNNTETLDWMGIAATRYNAELLRFALGEIAEPTIFLDPTVPTLTGKSVVVGGGWRPGNSSDASAVVLAETLDVKKVINLSNIDYVYDSDPKNNPDAKKFEKISWGEYLSFIPKDWDPGLSTPFDPVASREAEKAGIEVAIINGANLNELENYLASKEFKGTIIS